LDHLIRPKAGDWDRSPYKEKIAFDANTEEITLNGLGVRSIATRRSLDESSPLSASFDSQFKHNLSAWN
jgi:hypothetical protein